MGERWWLGIKVKNVQLAASGAHPYRQDNQSYLWIRPFSFLQFTMLSQSLLYSLSPLSESLSQLEYTTSAGILEIGNGGRTVWLIIRLSIAPLRRYICNLYSKIYHPTSSHRLAHVSPGMFKIG